MAAPIKVKFGTVEVVAAELVADSTLLQLQLLDGVMNKHEVGMLIKLLQFRRDPVIDLRHHNRTSQGAPCSRHDRATLCPLPPPRSF